ncbi:RNA polymerase sigma factor [Actinophytocola xanthii]|uniref:RNA polymerase subunit sigma-70 n=1 Tax=Actinophytocola xanthii TaxID=1912961 RepID=A0A1Q8C2Q9_9PSEU|nr:RNA polymerase sigma factor [Actinophytocola xanthii]OLF08624.1 RNA polymerase subunit sigma-70 [Actinophytocola xanthii]
MRHAPEHEVELANRAVDGDPSALEEVVRLVRDPVYRLAVRMAGRPADADDATQEILIRVVTRLASWRAEASLVTWAYRIAVNYLLNLRRTPYERNEITFDTLGEELAAGLADADHQGPDAELLATEVRLSCTQAMLQCLDRPERVAFVLGEVFALPSAQAGWILDISAAAYRKRLERARQRIRTFMSARCGLVHPAAPCRCARRVGTALERGRIDQNNPVFASHPATRPAPTPTEVGAGASQMRQLHAAATVLRSHPDYTAPRSRSTAVLTLLRSGHYPILSEARGGLPGGRRPRWGPRPP